MSINSNRNHAGDARYILFEQYLEWTAYKMSELTHPYFSPRFWMILLSGYVGTIVNHRNEILCGEFKPYIHFMHINYKKKLTLKVKAIAYLKFVTRAIDANRKLMDFQKLARNHREVMIGVNASAIKNGSILPPIECLPLGIFKKDKELRKELIKSADRESDPVKKSILFNVPAMWIEYLGFYLKKIENLHLHLEILHVERVQTNLQTLFCAFSVLRGAKLHYYQPGGHMGDMAYNQGFLSQLMKCDRFYTYGWVLNEKTVPGRAYRLEAALETYKNIKTSPAYDLTIVFSVLNEESVKRYLACMMEFYSNIDRNKYPRICLRPRGRSRLLNNRNELSFLPKTVRREMFVDAGKKPLPILMAQSRALILMDYPATAFLEAIYCRHPVLAILNRQIKLHDNLVPFITGFVQRGVLHQSATNLARYLNSTTLEEWWGPILNSDFFRAFDIRYAGGLHRSEDAP